jgi:hypothetical protein
MFQFPTFPPRCGTRVAPGRLPDLGDLRINACSAAPRSLSQPCHVLHRLWTPRHPPFTLRSLTNFISQYVHVLTTRLVFKDHDSPRAACAVPSRYCRRGWWRRRDSNPRPPGCKPGALPTELRPLGSSVFRLFALCWRLRSCVDLVVGLSGFEPLTSRLSGGRSNQLSYRPATSALLR